MVTMRGFWDLKRWRLQREGNRFLQENDGKLARRKLERLQAEHLRPQLQRFLAAHGATEPSLIETAQSALYQRLSTLRERRLPLPDLTTLAERTAAAVLSDARNEQLPARRQLQHRLLYLLRNRSDRFTLEKDREGTLYAGTPGTRPQTDSPRWRRLQAAPTVAGAPLREPPLPAGDDALATLLERLFRELGHAVELVPLVEVVAQLLPPTESSLSEPPLTPSTALAEKLESNYLLRQLWEALPFLPVRQRVVLLLGVHTPAGESLLPLFLAQGIASEAEIAQLLEIGPRSFPLLQKELPCDDNRLAELLKLAPESIRQLRQSARQKLHSLLELWGREPAA